MKDKDGVQIENNRYRGTVHPDGLEIRPVPGGTIDTTPFEPYLGEMIEPEDLAPEKMEDLMKQNGHVSYPEKPAMITQDAPSAPDDSSAGPYRDGPTWTARACETPWWKDLPLMVMYAVATAAIGGIVAWALTVAARG